MEWLVYIQSFLYNVAIAHLFEIDDATASNIKFLLTEMALQHFPV